jgi:hypothetical protein
MTFCKKLLSVDVRGITEGIFFFFFSFDSQENCSLSVSKQEAPKFKNECFYCFVWKVDCLSDFDEFFFLYINSLGQSVLEKCIRILLYPPQRSCRGVY